MISWIDTPQALSFLHSKLVFTASSSNVANTGFMYKVSITIAGDTLDFLVPPNPSDICVFDIKEPIRGYFYPRMAPTQTEHYSFHQLGEAPDTVLHQYEDADTTNWIMQITVDIREGWIISGVFTPTDVGMETFDVVVYASKFDVWRSLVPAYKESTDYISETFLTDRTFDTNLNGFPESNGYGFSSAFIKIGVRQTDQGVISFLCDDGTLLPTDTHIAKIRLTIYESDGTPNAATYNISNVGDGRICYFGAYPDNLNATEYAIIKPADYPDYRCYTIEMVDGGNNTYGQKLLFYPIDEENCNTMPVRLAWINSMGGWDYFWFTKLSVNRYEVERKRFYKPRGTYGEDTFSYGFYDRGLSEIDNNSDLIMTITSDWLEEGEFELLGHLIRSQHVYILSSDATGSAPTPVVVEQNNWADERIRGTALKKVELNLRFANHLW